MNAPVRPITVNAPIRPTTVQPIGVDLFEVDRRAFLASFREFMSDSRVPAKTRDEEFRSTLSALSQIAALSEIG